MTGTEKKAVSPFRGRRLGLRAKRVLQMSCLLVMVIIVALGITYWSINYPGESVALRDWVHRTRYGWLIWRLALYAALLWGVWKIWHAPGCKPEYRPPLKRMAIACVVFALVCEYSLFSGGLTL